MDQISRPLLIALVAVVGFAGVWMLVLRPRASGGEDSAAAVPPAAAAAPAPKAPGQAGLERSVDKAHGAVAASEASAAKVQSAAASVDESGADTPAANAAPAPAAPVANASPAPDTTPAPKPAAPAPKVAVAPKPAAPAQPAPSPAPQVTLLLFTGDGADDAVAREVVRSIHAPHVRTIVAPIAKVSDYSDLVGSVEIPGTPTILVIGTDHRAQRIVGLPDEAQVKQALAAAH